MNKKIILSYDMIKKAIMFSLEKSSAEKADEKKLEILTNLICGFFSCYNSYRIIDNILRKDERESFYSLELNEENPYGILKTEGEDNVLWDHRDWKTYYWQLLEERVIKFSEEFEKTQGRFKEKIQDNFVDDLYNKVPEDVWDHLKSSNNSCSNPINDFGIVSLMHLKKYGIEA